MPVFDAQLAPVGPGRFFANHPVVYRLSLAGSSGASAYALMRVGSPRGDRRPLWAAMALLEAGITVGIIRGQELGRDGGDVKHRPQSPTPAMSGSTSVSEPRGA